MAGEVKTKQHLVQTIANINFVCSHGYVSQMQFLEIGHHARNYCPLHERTINPFTTSQGITFLHQVTMVT